MPRRFKDKDIVKVWWKTRYAEQKFIGEVVKYENKKYYVRHIACNADNTFVHLLTSDFVFVCNVYELSHFSRFILKDLLTHQKNLLCQYANDLRGRVVYSGQEKSYKYKDGYYHDSHSIKGIYLCYVIKRLEEAYERFYSSYDGLDYKELTFELASKMKLLSLYRVFPTNDETIIKGRNSYV